MDPLALLDLVILAALFVFSALLSACETSLIALGRIRLAHAIEEGGKRGRALEAWRRDPNRLLTTILILNNVVNLTASTLAAFLAVHLAELMKLPRAQMGVLVAALVTLIIIVFGEVSPKLLAIHRSEGIALTLIRPLVFLDTVLAPVRFLVVSIANACLRPFGLKPSPRVPMVTEEEIRTLIEMGADAGVLEDSEHKMLHGVINLGDMQVREVMVPRTAIDGLDAEWDMDRILDHIIQAGYSRLPVFRETVDNIVGVVYAKDIISILQNRELIVLQDILRQPYFVPETKKVADLLREFQKGRIHVAVVVDEYGGTSGLVTLEDIIEEIVGDIRDEYDVEEKTIERTETNVWVVSGQTDIAEVNAALEIDLPDQKDLNTVGGFITDLLGHLPRKGENVTYEHLQFTVLSATSRKVERIQIRRSLPAAFEEGRGEV